LINNLTRNNSFVVHKILDAGGNFIDTANKYTEKYIGEFIASDKDRFVLKLLGENYTDGGIRTLMPIEAAIDAGATRIFAIAAGDPSLSDEPSFDNSMFLQIKYRALTEIMLDEILQKELKPRTPYNVPVTLIQSTVHIHDSLTIDPGLISISIDYGYMRAFDAIDGGLNLTALSTLSDEIIKLRMKIWREECFANGDYTQEEYEERAIWRTVHPGEPLLKRIPDPDSLKAVREMKRKLKALVDQRRSLGGNLPSDVSSWLIEWERHAWDTYYIPTPWDYFLSRLDKVDEETPYFTNGISSYDLKSTDDRVFAFDYDSSGKTDHLVLYRPGTGTIFIIKKDAAGNWSPTYW
jgi:hypothetical protein